VPHKVTVVNQIHMPGTAALTIPGAHGDAGIPALPGQVLVLEDVQFALIPANWFTTANSVGYALLVDNGQIAQPSTTGATGPTGIQGPGPAGFPP
jgi:hypothetical protein